MSFAAELKAIESRFAAAWGNTTPVAYQNVPFTPPDNTSWVRLTVLPGDVRISSMGDTKNYRGVGIIDVGVFVPIGSAAARSRALADQAAFIFRGVQFSGISCRAPSIVVIGVVDGWFQISVSVPYYRDEIF